jgi:hypothetical protein
VELVARYSHVDLAAGAIDGVVLGKWHFGVNWWATERWKRIGKIRQVAASKIGGLRPSMPGVGLVRCAEREEDRLRGVLRSRETKSTGVWR